MKRLLSLLLVVLLVGCAAPEPPPPVPPEVPPSVEPTPPPAASEGMPRGTWVPRAQIPAGIHVQAHSPDGRWLAMVQRDGPTTFLWLVPTDGERGLFVGETWYPVLWTPRNTLIFYQMYLPEPDTWLEADPATGSVTPFLPELLSGRNAGDLQFSPDGRRLLVTTNHCFGCNKPSANNMTAYVIDLAAATWQEVGVDVVARWEGDRVVAMAKAPREGYSGIPTYRETDAQGVLLVSRPFEERFQVANADRVQWRVYRPDDPPGAKPLRILPGLNQQDAYNSFGVWWPDPPAGPVRLELWAEVRASVPDDPAAWPDHEFGSRELRYEGGRRWLVLSSRLVRVQEDKPPQQTVELRSGWLSDERNGWGVDWIGRILRTADGGRTWRVVTPDGWQRCEGRLLPQQVEAFGAGRATVAIACGTTTPEGKWSRESGQVTLFRTTDAGATWSSVTLDSGYDLAYPSTLTFADDDHGWLLVHPRWPEGGPGALFRTTDGGRTWTKVSDTKSGLPASRAISFLSPDRGWMASSGRLYVTEDGGRTWREQPLNRSGFNPAAPTWPGVPEFVTPTEGYLTLGGSQEGARHAVQRLLATRDGGLTWEQRSEREGWGQPHFLSPDVGYLWDYEMRTLSWTRDGGRTWTVESWEDRPVYLSEVRFLDEQKGYGVQDQLWTTADGGRTWSPVYPELAK